MSFKTPKIETFLSGEDLSANQYKFVKIGADREHVVAQTSGGGKIVGIQQNTPGTGLEDGIEVAMIGGGAKLKCGDAISALDYIRCKTDSSGGVASAGDEVGAIAYEDGAPGDINNAEVTLFHLGS